MARKALSLVLLVWCTLQGYAITNPGIQGKVSVRTLFLLNELESNKGKVNAELAERYSLMLIGDTYYAGGLIMVDKNVIETALVKWQAKAGTRAGNIFTVKVPVNNLAGMISEPAITYFELDNKVYLRTDSVRNVTGVSIVQQGLGLPKGYSGKGVVFGDIDGGFDYTHPDFYDSTGTIYRVKRVWNQNAGNTTGTIPGDFGYGVEFTTPETILNEKFSDSTGTHGTHVCGIAAGSGRGTGGRYKGVAFESDIVMVVVTNPKTNTIAEAVTATTSGILDGINYVLIYAQSVGKPAVINLSLGLHIGPHDGSALFDQACDALVGEGQILVGATGNEGGINMHYTTDFNPDTSTRISLVGFQGTSGLGLLNAWGDVGTDFCMNLFLKNNNNSTGRICTSQNYNGYVVLTSSTNDTCSVRIGANANNPINGKPEILVEMQNRQLAKGDTLVIELSSGKTGVNGKIHLWNGGAGGGAAFYGDGFHGDNNYTAGEIGGTGKRIISVGAFNSKIEYTNIAGEVRTPTVPGPLGTIGGFSSRGPTIDNRIKPDITAPGNVVVSSVSSFDKRYKTGGSLMNTVVDTIAEDENTWRYATLYGTSMATPCVAGIIALLLEAKPNLSQGQIKKILQDNAIRDNNVLLAGAVPNNTWGYGKVNALQVMQSATPVNEVSANRLLIYPNPAQGYVTIIADNKPMQVQLCDLTGRRLLTSQTTGDISQLDVSSLGTGIYMLNIQQGDKAYNEKLVVE